MSQFVVLALIVHLKFHALIIRSLTTELFSLDTRQNVICLPVKTVCSTRRVNNGSVHGNWFKWAMNDRSWYSTGSEIMSLSRREYRNKWNINFGTKKAQRFVYSSVLAFTQCYIKSRCKIFWSHDFQWIQKI